jgi:tRNA(Leu) C34 or U34 (ribose-2'-O)-methylase TrmL
MGLNHMNGRVQDAITGRFLSPDPTIPDPTGAQIYNRFSYVMNNPLTLVDPSGFCWMVAPTDTLGWDGIEEVSDDYTWYNCVPQFQRAHQGSAFALKNAASPLPSRLHRRWS